MTKKTQGRVIFGTGLAVASAPAIVSGPLFYGVCNTDPSGMMLLCTMAGIVGGVTMTMGSLIANPENRAAFLQRLNEWVS